MSRNRNDNCLGLTELQQYVTQMWSILQPPCCADDEDVAQKPPPPDSRTATERSAYEPSEIDEQPPPAKPVKFADLEPQLAEQLHHKGKAAPRLAMHQSLSDVAHSWADFSGGGLGELVRRQESRDRGDMVESVECKEERQFRHHHIDRQLGRVVEETPVLTFNTNLKIYEANGAACGGLNPDEPPTTKRSTSRPNVDINGTKKPTRQFKH